MIELLEALSTKVARVSTSDLAGELKASKEGTLKQLKREKDKGHVDGNSTIRENVPGWDSSNTRS